jgi:hypothetical protein
MFEQEKLENQHISVRDNNHRVLLSGYVVQGEVSGWINQLDNIDIRSISIIPKQKEDE